MSTKAMTGADETPTAGPDGLYREDGVKISYNPYDPEIIEKYGAPGQTDDEGFNPYRDTVGPGIYGGIVKRDEKGEVVIGRQYQDHNPRPGPVYAGGGYTPMVRALKDGPDAVVALLDKYPDLVRATPGLAHRSHMCMYTAYISSRASVRWYASAPLSWSCRLMHRIHQRARDDD
jgi:hypothetical protein